MRNYTCVLTDTLRKSNLSQDSQLSRASFWGCRGWHLAMCFAIDLSRVSLKNRILGTLPSVLSCCNDVSDTPKSCIQTTMPRTRAKTRSQHPNTPPHRVQFKAPKDEAHNLVTPSQMPSRPQSQYKSETGGEPERKMSTVQVLPEAISTMLETM